MTDRYSGFIVTLKRDIREDDAEATIAAIRHIKGVVSVSPVVSEPLASIAASRERQRIAEAMHDVIWPESKQGI